MKYGVIIMRAQPVHKGHIDIINQALDGNDRVLVVIGSANKSGTKRNPLPINVRIELLHKALIDYALEDVVDVMVLSDWSAEDAYQYAKEWGSFLYYNIVNEIQTKTFTIYYNDNPETVRNWFTPEIAERIKIKSTERVRDISGTKVREAFENDDVRGLKEMLCPSTFKQITELKKLFRSCNKEDHIMY